jgi:hypothetical protein
MSRPVVSFDLAGPAALNGILGKLSFTVQL